MLSVGVGVFDIGCVEWCIEAVIGSYVPCFTLPIVKPSGRREPICQHFCKVIF